MSKNKQPVSARINKRIIHYAFFSILLAITVFSALILYKNMSVSQEKNFNNINLETLNVMSQQVYNHILSDIEYYNNETSSLASALDYISSKEDRIRYLEEWAIKMDSIYGIIDSSGNMNIISSDISINMRGTPFYTNAMDGLSFAGLFNSNTIIDNQSSFIVFSSPISSLGKDTPNGAICKLMNPDELTNTVTLNTNQYQLVLCDSGQRVLSHTGNTRNSIPLYQLITESGDKLEFTRSNKPNDYILLYQNGDTSQYIKKTTGFFKDWTIYTSINNTTFDVDVSSFRVHFILFISLFIILFIIEITLLLIPGIRARSEKKVEETRGLFIASMSHELRTPLNTIIGISEILSRSELSAGQHREVLYITDAGKHLLAMINDILDYSKLQSERFELVTEKYDLESLIYDITTVATVRLDNKPVEFMVHISPVFPRYVIGDMARVRQILNNIISNAVKYTQTGSIVLTLDCDNTKSNNIELIFKVKDTGIGIKKENIGKLFNQYTRFDSSINKNVEGTGLGLGIAKQFAQLMDGDITVTSTYGVGSEFTINIIQSTAGITDNESLLPEYIRKDNSDRILILEKSQLLSDYYTACLDELFVDYKVTGDNYEFSRLISENNYKYVLADNNTIQMIKEEMDNNNNTTYISLVHNSAETINVKDTLMVSLFPLQICTYLTGRRQTLHRNTSWNSLIIYPMPEKNILVVDDNNMNLQVTRGILEPYKMNVEIADSGKKAIEMAGIRHYDLIFMDHMMPEMDGEEAMNNIRRLYPDYKYTPIIALTANAAAGARKMFVNMGFDDFIPKPLETGSLHELLYKWLKPENTEEAIEFSPEKPVLEQTYEKDSCINFNEGLDRIGSMPIYLKTLRNFCDTIPAKADIIRKSFPDDMKTFVIEVHGLKGLAAIVSANDLTKQSFELEMLGKSDDIDTIRPLLPDYYTYLDEVKLCAERFIEEYS